MTSEATMTVVKMLETLPEKTQDQVIEHLREYIEDLREESLWNESFFRTQSKLVSEARRVRKEITEGKATPMDIGKL